MTTCVICLDTAEARDASTLRCGHIFHTSCILTALRSSSLCPMCRDKGHDADGREDALALISDTFLQRFQYEAAHICLVNTVQDQIKEKSTASDANKDIINEFKDAKRKCKKQATLIKKNKLQKFNYFKQRYYAEEMSHHAEFRLRKKRLYRAMSQLGKLLALPSEEWTIFSKHIYEECGKNGSVPISTTL
jgi:hypothetical protein